MTNSVKPIPEGFHTATPTLVVKTPLKPSTITRKYSAPKNSCECRVQTEKSPTLKSKSAIQRLFLSDEFPQHGGKSPQTLGGFTGGIYLYVPDVDEVFDKAIAAGGKSAMPVTDMFWGDRHGNFIDPFGHSWGVSTHTEDLSEEEMEKRAQAFYAEMEQKQKKSA